MRRIPAVESAVVGCLLATALRAQEAEPLADDPAAARGRALRSRVRAGTTVFAAATATADSRWKAAAIAHDGSTVVGSSDVAIGDLIISQ